MPETSRGPYAKGRDRREAILNAARDAFAEYGYRGASVAHIAERAGMSDAGLLHHFPTKQQLLLAVLERRDRQDVARVLQAVDAHATFADALIQLCDQNASTPGLVRLFTVMAAESIEPEHPGHEHFRKRYEWFRAVTMEQIVAAQERSEMDPTLDVESLAAQILALFDGLQVQWLLDRESVDMVAAFRDFLARVAPPD